MNTKTNPPPHITDLVSALQKFSNEGYVVCSVAAGQVEAGDYLLSYRCGFESPPEDLTRTRTVKCELVVATGSWQRSGPSPSQQTIALKDNPDVQQFVDNPNVLILRKKDPL